MLIYEFTQHNACRAQHDQSKQLAALDQERQAVKEEMRHKRDRLTGLQEQLRDQHKALKQVRVEGGECNVTRRSLSDRMCNQGRTQWYFAVIGCTFCWQQRIPLPIHVLTV